MSDLTPETLRACANSILRGEPFQELDRAEGLRKCAAAWQADRDVLTKALERERRLLPLIGAEITARRAYYEHQVPETRYTWEKAEEAVFDAALRELGAEV